ncbi:MAG: hypothetical protein IPG50_28320 [Myxococcales bacterium]|nr:hypothetical protein [Myxococcales bacterium]
MIDAAVDGPAIVLWLRAGKLLSTKEPLVVETRDSCVEVTPEGVREIPIEQGEDQSRRCGHFELVPYEWAAFGKLRRRPAP